MSNYFFQSLFMASPRAHHYSVYVIELSPEVWDVFRFRRANPDYQPGKPMVYVGMTGLDIDLRFDKHKAGIQSNGSCVTSGFACCRGYTASTTRCRMKARATWKSSWA